MGTVHVMFEDSSESKVIAVFGGPQDPEKTSWENLGEIEEDDDRYLQWLNPPIDNLPSARIERDRLISYSTLKINPLQDSVDIGEATDDDLSLLNKWKKYRSDLGKMETKQGWPDSPQWPVPPVALEVGN
ncbi:tail fiber assembly protein [Pseudomonas sp. AO-1]|uniref:tail fiber assembly protein n=1 Tax=Pseudomonas sp. AO-1 TaxID=2855434 RepID=UPI001C783B8D|nr:tail fiber assembly protein [Pseudomonas sp. AO-1]QXZ11715.1 tail fiber assembly protein [Pseudomonas sp. AO-1]